MYTSSNAASSDQVKQAYQVVGLVQIRSWRHILQFRSYTRYFSGVTEEVSSGIAVVPATAVPRIDEEVVPTTEHSCCFLRSDRTHLMKMWITIWRNSHHKTAYIFKSTITNISLDMYYASLCLDNLPNFHRMLFYLNIEERSVAHFPLKAMIFFLLSCSVSYSVFCIYMYKQTVNTNSWFMGGAASNSETK